MIFSALDVGGAETWLMSILKYCSENADELPFQIKIDVCLTSGQSGFFDDSAKVLGANLHYIKYTRKNLPSFIFKFRKLLKEGRYHAIHDHQDYTAGWHFLFGIGYLPRVRIAHIHNPTIHINTYTSKFSRKTIVAVGKFLLRYFASDIAGTSRQIINEYGFEDTVEKKAELTALHCGFDVKDFLFDEATSRSSIRCKFDWEEDVKIILFVGRLDSTTNGSVNQKNPEFALKVMNECIENDPSIRCLMVGGGDGVKGKLLDKVISWGLEKKIVLTGVRSDIAELMTGADLLLFPSLAEGLGMVAVEAQSAGLPVLTSDTTPRECVVIPEMVTFKSLNKHYADWADEALKLINLPPLDKIACNYAVKNSPFSIDNSVHKLIKMYSSYR
jgi:glycosyltransferase EpsF